MSKIIFLSHNATDHTLTFAVDGKRYEYQMSGPLACDIALSIIRRISIGKGFAYVKRGGMLLETTS